MGETMRRTKNENKKIVETFIESPRYKYKRPYYYQNEPTVEIDFWKRQAIFAWEGED